MKDSGVYAKKIIAEFYRTEAGNEPVREHLRTLGRPAWVAAEKKTIRRVK
jgi:hypothetical protein